MQRSAEARNLVRIELAAGACIMTGCYPPRKGRKEGSVKRTYAMLVIAAMLGLAVVSPVAAQAPTASSGQKTTTDMDILKDKLKADKKLIVAATLELTEAEAKGFWPIYDAYQAELQGINNRLAKVIQSYATDYTAATMTDEKAAALTTEALAVEEAETALKKKYAQKLTGVIPAKKIARAIQVENKVRAAIKYDLAGSIPFVQ